MTGAVPGPGDPDEGRHRADFTAARRPSGAALALEHEAARMRAKLMDPETALRELAERLTFAHVHAGKPALAVLSEAVHYSKGTLSKVFAGKMVPSWPLVENLAVELGVPTQTVVREWFHLWTAANTLRRRPGVARERATAPPEPGTAPEASAGAATGPGYTCRACGSWVVDPALHTEWHRQVGEAGRSGPDSGTTNGWAVPPHPINPNGEVPRGMGFSTDLPYPTGASNTPRRMAEPPRPADFAPRAAGHGDMPRSTGHNETPRVVEPGGAPRAVAPGDAPRAVGLSDMPWAGGRTSGVPGR